MKKQKPKVGEDTPVSLYPLKFEEALKMFLKFRPPPKSIGEIRLQDIGLDKPPAKYLGNVKEKHVPDHGSNDKEGKSKKD